MSSGLVTAIVLLVLVAAAVSALLATYV